MRIIIIGGGASGLMAASLLNQEKKYDITIIERLEHVGKKLLVCGNGRCNFTNKYITKESYNNDFGFNIASSFDAVSYFNKLGLLSYHDNEGRYYPISNSATNVLNVLRESLDGVNIIENETALKINKVITGFEIITNRNTYKADKVIIATGGNSFYKDINTYDLAKTTGVSITSIRPVLCPIIVKENLASIENLRCDVNATLLEDNKVIYQDKGEVLFKKDALSGIVMFQLSSKIKDSNKKYQVVLDLLPSVDKETLDSFINNHPSLNGILPKMLNQYVLKNGNDFKHVVFNVIGNSNYKIAHVTSGGVSLNDLSDNLEVINNKGVYFVGEVVDVDGMCGGYNLQFAFASANKVYLAIKEND